MGISELARIGSGLLTVAEAAAFLRLHPGTVYRLVKQGLLPYVHGLGCRIRFRVSDLDKWLDTRAYSPPPVDFLGSEISLEGYDKLYLKGGVQVTPKGNKWNYSFGSVFLRLTKCGKERWHIYYRVDGKRIRKAVRGAQTRADALKVLQVSVADGFKGKHGFRKDEKRIGFREFGLLYIENYAKANKRTWKQDVYSIGLSNSNV